MTESRRELEDLVGRWRRSLAGHETVSGASADELEEHLREQVEDLLSGADLSEEEAFLVAVRRVGSPVELALAGKSLGNGAVGEAGH